MRARTTPSEVPCREGRGTPSVSRTRPRRASLTTLLSSRHEVGRDIVLTDRQLLFSFLEKLIPEGYLFCLRECQVCIQAQASKDSIFARLPQSSAQACLHLLPNFLHSTAHLCTVEQQNLPRTRNNDQRCSCSNLAFFQGLTGEHEFSRFPNHYGSHHMHTSLAKAIRNEERRIGIVHAGVACTPPHAMGSVLP